MNHLPQIHKRPHPPHRSLRATVGQLVPASLLAAYMSTSASAVTELERGDPIPPIVSRATDGRTVDTSKLRGETLVVLFGESGHEKTRLACEHVRAALDHDDLADEKTHWILVLSKHSDPQELGPEVQNELHRPCIIHDANREAFGAYKIAVLPSVVVVDRESRVVHATAGLIPRFGDVLTDAMLLAAGKIGDEQFEQTLHPVAESDGSHDQRRAERLIQLARQLAQRGMYEAAADRYREALQLAPDSEAARLALADLLRRNGRLDEAEALCRAALAGNPKSLNAAVTLAFVQLARGGEQLDTAETLVRDVLHRSPSFARAHYLLGRILEQRGQIEEAAASYRRAAEQLIEPREGPSSS